MSTSEIVLTFECPCSTTFTVRRIVPHEYMTDNATDQRQLKPNRLYLITAPQCACSWSPRILTVQLGCGLCCYLKTGVWSFKIVREWAGDRAGSANSNSHSHRIRTNTRPAIRIRISIRIRTFTFFYVTEPQMRKIFQSFSKNGVKTNCKHHWVAGTMYKNGLESFWYPEQQNKEKNWSVDWKNLKIIKMRIKMRMRRELEFAFVSHSHWCELAKIFASHANSHSLSHPCSKYQTCTMHTAKR
jgi:hypothetical protein